MGVLQNFALLTVGIAVAGNVVLGFAVFFSDTKRPSNRWFFAFTVITAVWGIFNFLNYQTQDALLALWLIRGVIFFAVWQTLAFYLFLFYFSHEDAPQRSFSYWGSLVLAGVAAVLTLTPYVFVSVIFLPSSPVAQPSVGPAVVIFAFSVLFFVYEGISTLFQQFSKVNLDRHAQLKTLAWGAGAMFLLIVVFDLVAPLAFRNTNWIPLSPIFTMPFIVAASYSILRQHLFNMKVIATSALVFLLSIVSFVDIIFSTTASEIILRSGVFVLVLVFGINLIRGVLREVQQREEIQKLAEELSATNKRQEGLIHFIGHEVKSFLTKAQGVFSLLVEGDLGPLPEAMKPFIERGLQDTKDGVNSVGDILKASNIKRGTTEYAKEPFDLKVLAAESVEKARQLAEAKGLNLSFTAEDGDFNFTGDRGEIGDHVFRNLIDNAVSYTPTGSVSASLKRIEGKYIFAVKDSGVGITDEDKKHLFTEGGHGKDSQKVNIHSTGYGLYIAKNIVTAHGGTIRAESLGAGKGSTFVVEFPAQ